MKTFFIILIMLVFVSVHAGAVEITNVTYPSPEKAKQELKTLLPKYEINPKDINVLEHIGICYHSIGGAGDAEAVMKSIDFFNKALKLDPSNNEIKAWLGSASIIRARDVGIFEQLTYVNTGISLMDTAVVVEPNNITIRTTRANIYLYAPSFLGKDAVAVNDFEFVSRKLQGSNDRELLQEVYYKLGLAYKKINNTNKAKENFELAVNINNGSEIAKKIAKDEHL